MRKESNILKHNSSLRIIFFELIPKKTEMNDDFTHKETDVLVS